MNTEPQKRTLKQNNSIHLFFEECTNELNNAGVTLRDFVVDLEVPMTQTSTKAVFQGIAFKMYGKEHTSDLTTVELQKVFEVFQANLAMKGIDMTFPSFEDSEEYINSFTS